MGIYKPDELSAHVKRITTIWRALMELDEQDLLPLVWHDPWQRCVMIGGVSHSVQALCAELLTRCAKVIVRTHGPAFLIQPSWRKPESYSVVDVSLSGFVLLKTVQVILAFGWCQPLSFEKLHPIAGFLVWMLEKTNSGKVTKSVGALNNRSIGELCDELLFLHGHAFFSGKAGSLADVDDEYRIECINSHIVAFRDMVRCKSEKIRQWERPTERRRQKLMGELLPLIDSGVNQFYIVGMDLGLGSWMSSDDHEELRKFFLQFMNNLRFKPRLSKRLYRVIWRFSVDIAASSRYHCLFIFDRSFIGDGPQLSELIGSYWQTEITAGQGIWSDWSHHTSGSHRQMVGCIDLSDRNKISVFMDELISFFADFYLYIEPSFSFQLVSSDGVKLRMTGSRRFSSR